MGSNPISSIFISEILFLYNFYDFYKIQKLNGNNKQMKLTLIKLLKIVFGTGFFYLSANQLQRLAIKILESKYDLTLEKILEVKNDPIFSENDFISKNSSSKLERRILKMLIELATVTIGPKLITAIALLQSLGYFSQEIAAFRNYLISLISHPKYSDALTISVPQCGEVFNFAKDLLNNNELEYLEKEKIAESLMDFILNIAEDNIQSVAIICLVSLLCWLAISSPDGFYALLRALQKAYRDGRISKKLYFKILRKMRKAGIDTDL